MLLNGCSSISRSFSLKNKAWPANSYMQSSRLSAHFPSSGIGNSMGPSPWSSRGNICLGLSASSTPLLSPLLLTRRKSLLPPRAAKDVPSGSCLPAMTEKPKWLWRILACLPYLSPINKTRLYGETAYYLHDVFEFPKYHMSPLEKLPVWFWFEIAFMFTYFFVFIVRKKEFPHFFRSHMAIASLLGIAIDMIFYVCCSSPLVMYWGKLGVYFWAAMTFIFLFMVLKCIRCAIAGMYSDVPFVCDAVHPIIL